MFLRYLGFQLPGWLAVGGAMLGAMHWFGLPAPLAWSLFGLFVLKDLVLFRFVRNAYEPRSGSPGEAMVGRPAVARDELSPSGYVRFASELWRAELRSGGCAPVGSRLRVVEVRGLTLIVDPDEEEASS
ncbi:MAG: NfeD family protein [Myxococcota bacterium]